ncbi:MAG: ATP-binding cassette domain-containing protein [Gammaproteobacteria bacterium]|nr:ATP-binding cassette domain-containing protein [Gammaproteobacteria bacterium]MCZ6912263.1 ATP-binding cassette domain-containing protein [Pseudomonadota bacterium]
MSAVVLRASNLQVSYQRSGGRFLALDDVGFELFRGQTLAVVGESGSGKSTLAYVCAGLLAPEQGSVELLGRRMARRRAKDLKWQAQHLQMVFQDPVSSLNPRQTIAKSLAEPLLSIASEARPAADEISERLAELITQVGLRQDVANRYPHELSGGQCQRVAIARALANGPEVLICDEPVSALDISVQAQVINLLVELQQKLELSILFIAHDLGVVRRIASQVLVMHKGRIVERGPARQILRDPQHSYTRNLLASEVKLVFG